MTDHLKYLAKGIVFIGILAICIALAVAGSLILLLPAFLYSEIGISWALWLYVIYLVVVGYIVGRLSSDE